MARLRRRELVAVVALYLEAGASAVLAVMLAIAATRPLSQGACAPGQSCLRMDFRDIAGLLAGGLLIVAVACALSAFLTYRRRLAGIVVGLCLNLPAAAAVLYELLNIIGGTYGGGAVLGLGLLPLVVVPTLVASTIGSATTRPIHDLR